MGAIEPWHLILLLAVILLVVGPGKLPQVGKGVGEALREFRQATSNLAAPQTGPVPPAAPLPVPPAVTTPPHVASSPGAEAAPRV